MTTTTTTTTTEAPASTPGELPPPRPLVGIGGRLDIYTINPANVIAFARGLLNATAKARYMTEKG